MGRGFGFVQYGGYVLSDCLIAKATDVGFRWQLTLSADDLSDRLVIWFPAVQDSLIIGDQLVARFLDFCLQRRSSYSIRPGSLVLWVDNIALRGRPALAPVPPLPPKIRS